MINKVVLVGRITKDPEIRQAGSNNCCNFTLACNRRYTNKDGNREADFINCVAWNQSANYLSSYARKGNLIGVEGRIQTRNYDGQDGRKVYVTEVVCDNVTLLESRNSQGNQTSAPNNNAYNNSNNNSYQSNNDQTGGNYEDPYLDTPTLDISSDDLPFY
ncbi:MAG: single-stranded DNA-binding protein [Erysipelotrichaceae bacterium]|nr:single-stranded DNA-binding protein [Erysipelotrichaceae bacterium]